MGENPWDRNEEVKEMKRQGGERVGDEEVKYM